MTPPCLPRPISVGDAPAIEGGIAVFTVISGIVPQITGWHNDNAIHRTVFVNVPDALVVAFYTIIPVMLVWGSIQFANRMKNWERGAPAKRKTTAGNGPSPGGFIR